MNFGDPEEFSMIVKILQKSNFNKSNMLVITKILTNWNYHEILNADGVEELLDVCLKICEDDSLFMEGEQMWNLFSYIMKSPNRKVEKSVKYYQLL